MILVRQVDVPNLDMSNSFRIFLFSVISLGVLGLLFSTSLGQTGRPPKIEGPQIQPRLVAADYHLVHAGNSIYRYNSRTGETQSLTISPQSTGIGYNWVSAVEGSGAPPAGEPGRYEVAAGDNSIGVLIRVDTQLGGTWVASSTNGAIHWNWVTK